MAFRRQPTAEHAVSPSRLALHLSYQLDLHASVHGEGGDPEGCAGVAALVAEDLDEHIGSAIQDARLLREVRDPS